MEDAKRNGQIAEAEETATEAVELSEKELEDVSGGAGITEGYNGLMLNKEEAKKWADCNSRFYGKEKHR